METLPIYVTRINVGQDVFISHHIGLNIPLDSILQI